MVRDCFTHMTVIYCISHVQTLGEKLCGQQEEDAAFGENGVQPQIAIY